jgi:hypothetical protein
MVFRSIILAVIVFFAVTGVAAAQTNTSLGTNALVSNTTGVNNTAIGLNALASNSIGDSNRHRGQCAR